jgi:hypothetical protein
MPNEYKNKYIGNLQTYILYVSKQKIRNIMNVPGPITKTHGHIFDTIKLISKFIY